MECEAHDLKSVNYGGDYRLIIVFDDDVSKVIDLRNDVIKLQETRYQRLLDKAYFSTAHIHEETGSLAWDNGYDICPDLLYQIGIATKKRLHKPGCGCPICRNTRGERKRTKKYAHVEFRFEVIEKLRNLAEKKERTVTSLVNEAVDEYLEKHSA